jgi:glycosyltransferase involved in cell wall biosynthesis
MSGSVLIVGNFLSGSGKAPGVCEGLAARLEQAGWSVVTTSREPRRLARLLDILRTIWSRRREYEVAQVDVYSGSAFLWAEAACLMLHRLRKPYCLTLHGGALPAFARRWPTRVRSLVRKADAVTSPSEYQRQELQAFRHDIRLVPNALDLERYPFRRRDAPRPRLVWLRSFHDIYNPVLAPRVVALLRGDFADVTLRMIGPDKGDGSLERTKAEAERCGVSDRIEFIAAIPKTAVPAALGEADVFLNTTDVDNAPVSVIEAMACGLCVVSTAVGGIPHLIEDGRNGLLTPAGDATAMANAVRRALTEPGLARRLSEEGRRASERSDWSNVLPQWKSILGRLSGSALPEPLHDAV